MKKIYNRNKNVYEAAMERLEYIFSEFDNIYVSFSGGKDSGVMINMVLDYIKRNNIKKRVGLLFIDLEAFYKSTIEFIENIFFDNKDLIIPYWVCLPMLTTNSVSMYEPYWIFWDEDKKEKWVRDMPDHDFVINMGNNPFGFYRYKMTFEEFIIEFGKWYAKEYNAKTACLVGVRSDESLNRFRAIARDDKSTYKNKIYSTKVADNVFNFYPVYDWRVEDIWTYNGRFNKPYNKFYDLAYRAGVPLSKMRICEPYGDEQKAGLNMFKIIEPETWFKVVDRVSGANFGNIYCSTKATGSRKIELPNGHTWKSYCKYLLQTLPAETRKIYEEKFIKFINYWRKHGSPLDDNTINELNKSVPDKIINTKQYSKRGKGDKYVVKFKSIPDEVINDNKTDMLSWKRMCMAILKNDITCQSLSFSITKRQALKRQEIINKYKDIL